MKRKVLWTIVVLIALTILSGCAFFQKSDDELIRNRIDRFLTAYNTGDMDAVLDCLDAKTRNTFKSAINLTEAFGGKVSGIDGITVSDLFGIGVGTMSEGNALTIEIQKINVKDESSATVDVTMSYTDQIQSFSEQAFFTMLKEDGDWYIKNFENK